MHMQRKRRKRLGLYIKPSLTKRRLQSELPTDLSLEMTVCRLAARRLVSKALQGRKQHAGLLLGSLKSNKSIKLNEESDFGNSCHTRSTELFFYEVAYQPVVARNTPIPINERGECVVAEEIPCEPSENVPSVDSDSALTPKSDSVPKFCKK